MNFNWLFSSLCLLVWSNFNFAQTQLTQKEIKPLTRWDRQHFNFPDIPVFLYPGDDAAKKAQAPNKKKPEIDPVATGLRSNNEKAVPIVKTSVRTIAVDEAGDLLAIGTGQGEILIYSLSQEKYETRWKGHDEWVFDLAFDSESKTLISGGGDAYTKFWSVDGWKRTDEYLDHQDDVHGVAISSDGQTLVTGGDDTLVLVRHLKTGKINELKGHLAQVTSVISSADGKRAFSSSRDQTIRVWDLEKMESIVVLKGHQEDVLHLAIDRSGNYLASASYDGTVRIWSLETFKTEQILRVPDVWMLSVEFSDDASMVFAGSTDFYLRAFDRKSQKELWKSKTISDASDLVLTPDGKHLIASSAANGIFLYEVDREKGVISKKINVTGYTTPRVAPLTTSEYLHMHHALLYQQDRDDWGKRVGLLSIHGDQFTDHLLQKMEISELPAPKRELATRLQNRLRAKYEPFEEAPLSERMLTKFWGNYAVARYMNIGVSKPLQKWLHAETLNTKDSINNRRFDLKRFEKAINYSLQAHDSSGENVKKIIEVQQQVINELKNLLDEKIDQLNESIK